MLERKHIPGHPGLISGVGDQKFTFLPLKILDKHSIACSAASIYAKFLSIQYFIDINIFKNGLIDIDIDIFKNDNIAIFKNDHINIDIFNNYHINIDIFQKC